MKVKLFLMRMKRLFYKKIYFINKNKKMARYLYTGELPNKKDLKEFTKAISERRKLPTFIKKRLPYFTRSKNKPIKHQPGKLK